MLKSSIFCLGINRIGFSDKYKLVGTNWLMHGLSGVLIFNKVVIVVKKNSKTGQNGFKWSGRKIIPITRCHNKQVSMEARPQFCILASFTVGTIYVIPKI